MGWVSDAWMLPALRKGKDAVGKKCMCAPDAMQWTV